MIEVGMTYTAEKTVTPDMTAKAVGSGGLEVFGTPFMMGFIVVNREYKGMTPVGMTFGELASCTGGGVQTPGYMGHGRHFIASKKFIAAEGGPGRIVWLPKDLKEQMREKLDATAKELYGVDNFTDMIADETVCTDDPEQLLAFLSEVGHPVLSMEPFDM